MEKWVESGNQQYLRCLDLDTCDLVGENTLSEFLVSYGGQLLVLNLGGHPKLTENFWTAIFPRIATIK